MGRIGRTWGQSAAARGSGPLGTLLVLVAAVAAAGLGATASQAAATARPSVSALSVKSGSTGGGTRLRIHGHGFTHVQWVKFGSTRARIVARPSSTTMVVTSPAHRAGVVDIRVRATGRLSTTQGHDRFRFVPPPVQVSVGSGSGTTFACDRTGAGAVACWGDNFEGELGNGTTTFSKSPVKVKGLQSGVRDISTGEWYACAVTATHAAKCWGWENLGVLGNGVNDINGHVTRPVSVQGLTSGVRSIVADGVNTCAVTTVGVVKCWGAGYDLQLGTNDPGGASSAVPITIAGLPRTASVAIGYDFACALTTTGAVYCWGLNTYGELGAGSGPGLESATPVQVQGLSAGVRSLSAGDLTACAVTATRAVKCWGGNGSGVLGDGHADNVQVFSNVPVTVKGMGSGQRVVTVGDYNTACAVNTLGRVKCWGYNYDGTLGNGNDHDSPVPVQVKGITRGANQVAIGTYTVCALTRTGQVKCWGYVPVGRGLSEVPVTLPWAR